MEHKDIIVSKSNQNEAYSVLANQVVGGESIPTINRACPLGCKGNIESVWQDQPDSEGWWWRLGILEHLPIHKRLSCEYYDDVAVNTWDFYGMGKYCKAIVPTVPEREE